jgi:hypothetical protein
VISCELRDEAFADDFGIEEGSDEMANGDEVPAPIDPRIVCFERVDVHTAFEVSLIALMGDLQNKSRAAFVSEHNILRMNHGDSWVHSAREEEPDTTMHSISAEWSIPFNDIAENDLALIMRTVRPINEAMEGQFARNMYAVVGAAAEKAGNVVDAQKTGSFAQSMLEMFRKIELGVDRDGNVTMPQLHVGTEAYKRIAEEMQCVPPEIEAEIEAVKAVKTQAALEKEAQRKAKFRRIAE